MSLVNDLDDQMDEFLDDDDNVGGRAGYLNDKEWKDKGVLDFWLQQAPLAFWSHPWPMMWEVRPKKDQPQPPTGTVHLTKYFSRDQVCPEHQSVHTKRAFRDDRGKREAPPTTCGICKMAEWVDSAIRSGQLDWLEPVFRFVGTHPESKPIVIRAGGLVGLFKSRKLTDQQLAAMNAAGLSPQRDWNQSLQGEKKYKIALVDNANVGKVVQITTQKTQFTGEIRRIINDRKEKYALEKKDPEHANPLRHPYMFRMRYDKEQQPMKRLTAIAADVPVTDELRLLLANGPELKRTLKVYSPSKMKGYMQAHMLIQMPLDQFFENMQESTDEEEEFPFGANAVQGPATQAASPPATQIQAAPTQAGRVKVQAAANTIPCDDCQYPMLETDTECPNCHCKYAINPTPPVVNTVPKGAVSGDTVPFFQEK